MNQYRFAPIKPRVTATTFRGHDGALLDLPGHRGRGIFIPAQYMDRVLDQLDHIEAQQAQQ